METKQRAGKVLKEWALLGVLTVVLHVGFFGGMMLLNPRPGDSLTPIWVLTAVYLVAGAALMVWFYRRVSLANDPMEYREAREQGLPATAKILEIEQTKWTSGRNRASMSFTVTLRPFSIHPRRTKYEQKMRVRISREGMADYEATIAEFLTGDQIPKKGATIPVKVHPQHPEIIVVDLAGGQG